ncbi:MAG: hypothetical protein R2790_06460, partial [Flavobacterium haoranii]
LETILFSYIFGIKKGWAEINKGADIKLPGFYKYIILIVTPALLGWVLISSIPDWVDKIKDNDTHNKEWFADAYFAENFESTGKVTGKVVEATSQYLKIAFDNEKKVFDKATGEVVKVPFTDYKEYNFKAENNQEVIVKIDQVISPADKIATGKFTNNTLYKFLGRMLLLALFIFISIVVLLAYKKRVKEGRATL